MNHELSKTESILDLLLAHGAKIDDEDFLGRTALARFIVHSANRFVDYQSKLELLIAKGANVNVRQKDSKTPMYLVLDRGEGELELCHFFIDHKALVCMPINLNGKVYDNAAVYALALGKHACYDFLIKNKEPATSLEKQVQDLQKTVESLLLRIAKLEERPLLTANQSTQSTGSTSSGYQPAMFGLGGSKD